MSCDTYREILSAMLDDAADPEETAACLRHVETCAGCARYRQELLSDRTLLLAWPDETPGLARAGRQGLRSPAVRGWWVPRLAAAAALLVTLGMGFLAGRTTAPRPEAFPAPPSAGSAFRETRRTVYPESKDVYSYAVLRIRSERGEAEGGQ